MKKLLLALAITVVAVIQPALAYDFSAVSPSGQTLYYNIVGDNTVEVTSQNSNSPYYSNGGPAGTLTIPSSVIHPNTGITYNVISIGTDALRNCDYLTFVTIPNSVTSIEYGAFYNCDRLSNIDFGDSVISIGGSVFYRCYSLADIVFPESLRTIGGEAFRHSNITSVTFPTALITVDETAFWECPNFSKAYFLDSLPPYDNNFFTGFHASIYVPCQYVSNYQNAFFWDSYILSRIHGKNYDWEPSYNFVVNDSTLGSINYGEIDCDSNVVVTVNVNEGYTLTGWSDGGTGNPRTFHITGDTMVTAIIVNPFFSAIAPSGQTLYYNIVDNNRVVVVNQNNVTWEPYYSNGGPAGALVIPDSVTHPNSGIVYVVDSIGDYAFAHCDRLISVSFPNTLRSIGYAAFDWSGLLSHVEFGNSLEYIGTFAFSGCSSIAGDLVFPETLRFIGDNAFLLNGNGVTSVTIQNSLITIGNGAFANCNNLSKIYLTDTFPPFIVFNTFEGCNANFYVPCQSLSKYDTALVWNNLSSRIYGKNYDWEYSYDFVVNDSTLGSINYGDIDCDSNIVVRVNTNNGFKLIGWSDGGIGNPRTFHLTGDTMVTAIIIDPYFSAVAPSGQTLHYEIINYTDVAVVRPGTGNNYNNYVSGDLIIPDTVTHNGITYNVTELKKIGSTSYGSFYNCSGLTSVTIPNSVTSIGNYVFYGCRGLTSVTIPNSVTSIGNSAFYNCSSLTSVTIPNSVTSIGGHAFFGCSSLTSITLPDSLTSIETHCFYNCSSLTSIIMPSSLTSLGNYAFDYCYSLQKVYFEGITPPTITSSSFSGCGSVLFYVSCQSINAYRNASYWSNYSSRIYGMNYDWEHSYDFVLNNDSLGMLYFEPIDCDSNVVVTVIPYEGYQFVGWSDGGTENPRTFHLIGDTMVTAIIDYVSYTIIGQPNDTVRGTVVGSNTVHYGDSVFIEALANYGYHFTQWDDGNTDNPRLIVVTWDVEDTTIMVTHNVTYTALFDKNNYNVSLAVDDDTHGYVTGMGAYEYLDVCTISAIANEGYRFTHWSDGNTDNPRTITIDKDTSITAFFTDYIIPQICMVSVQNGRNTVLWEKGLEVENYNIYRESNIADEYELVAIIPYDSLSIWVDTVSKPTSRSYRYRMTTTDTSGYESEPGDVHKTMHLTINKGIGNQWNLVWTEYEGAPYTTYVIYRGTNASNIQQIDVMPAGGNTTYTDENAPEGDVYYQVGVMMSSPCNPSKSSSIIMSNIATNGNVGIQNIDLTDVNIFSRMGEIIVENSSGKPIQVLDVLGRTIYLSNTISYNDYQVTISVPKSGVYLVKVGDCPTKKVVVVK
ncbi:MAG: leucine-rich repeat protein [Bacteroidales bacterium]|nr:leucine-rich repeat protein [Bacteroidales bacterium]